MPRDDAPVLKLAEFCDALRITRATAYRMEARGQLRLIRVASAVRVLRSELDRILAGESPVDVAERPQANASSPVTADAPAA